MKSSCQLDDIAAMLLVDPPRPCSILNVAVEVVCMFVLSATWSRTVRGQEVPDLHLWESKMIRSGQKWGEYLNPAAGKTLDERLGAQYYDSQWVFYQISDYTGKKEPWLTYASYAKRVYRDEYLIPNNFRAQGFRRFPEGLYEDYRRGGNTTMDHLRLLRDNPAYSNLEGLLQGPDRRSGYSEALSREVAYSVGAHLVAEKAGLPRAIDVHGAPIIGSLVAMMENHLSEWRHQEFKNSDIGRVAPFMMGLTAYALIDFYEWEVVGQRDPNALWPDAHWPTIDAALIDVFSWLHDDAKVIAGEELSGKPMWLPLPRIGEATFRFMDRTITSSGGPEPAPDLNQLVAPTYYWLYKHTGDKKYRLIGDELFAAGVRYGSAEQSGKHFNQQYRLSFRSLEWRAAGDRRSNGNSLRPKSEPVK
jgi:hypothetical protein